MRECIEVAGTAPSGAYKQPWTFCIVTGPTIRKEIRKAAEEEEFINYNVRMSEEWLDELKQFKTDHIKPFIENVPGLIILCQHSYEKLEEGKSQIIT